MSELLSKVPHSSATDDEIENYARGVVTGVMQRATPNVVGSLLTRIRDDAAHCRALEAERDETRREAVRILNHDAVVMAERDRLTTRLREVEAERDTFRESIRQGTIMFEPVIEQRIEDFRRRAIEAVRAHVGKYDDHYMHCLTKCIPELLQSLPAGAGTHE